MSPKFVAAAVPVGLVLLALVLCQGAANVRDAGPIPRLDRFPRPVPLPRIAPVPRAGPAAPRVAAGSSPLQIPDRAVLQVADTVTPSVTGRLAHIYVDSSVAPPAVFLLRKNNRFQLERAVSQADGRTGDRYRMELGAILIQPKDRLDLMTADPVQQKAAHLVVVPFTDAEAKEDHTAALRAAHSLVFKDDFDSLQTTPGTSGGLWTTALKRGVRIHNTSPDSLYSDGTFSQQVGAGAAMNPFSISGGILSIKGGQIPASALAKAREALGPDAPPDQQGPNALRYYSGSLSTSSSWSQTYGYFEMRAKLPRGTGTWPAFWLTASVGWPPEIDMLEAVYHADTGRGVNQITSTLHYKRLAQGGAPMAPNLSIFTEFPADVFSANLYNDFHLYAAEWTPQWVSVFLDGRLIYKVAAPAQLSKPMTLMANLQLGTRNPQPGWGADIANPADLANPMQIDFISDYRATDTYPTVNPGPDASVDAPPPVFPAAGANLVGDDRANTFHTGSGLDLIHTGGGADTIIIHGQVDSHKIIDDFDPAGGDKLVLDGFPFATPAEALQNAKQVGPDVWIMAGAIPIAPQTVILRGKRLDQIPASSIVTVSPKQRRAPTPAELRAEARDDDQ